MMRACVACCVLVLAGAAYAQPVDDGTVPTDPSEYGIPAGWMENLSRRTKHSATWDNGVEHRTITSTGVMHYRSAGVGPWKKQRRRWRADGQDWIADERENPVRIQRRHGKQYIDFFRGSMVAHSFELPNAPSITGNKATFSRGGIECSYYLGDGGVKLECTVTSSLGNRTWDFTHAGDALTLNDDGSLSDAAGWVWPRPFVTDSNGAVHDCGTWFVNGNTISFTWDDTGVPTPYTLDPTSYYTTSEDGQIIGSTDVLGGDYPGARNGDGATFTSTLNKTNTAMQVGQGRSGDITLVYRDYLPFDTSAITAGASVTDVDMYLASTLDLTLTDFSPMIVEYSGWGSTLGADATDRDADYNGCNIDNQIAANCTASQVPYSCCTGSGTGCSGTKSVTWRSTSGMSTKTFYAQTGATSLTTSWVATGAGAITYYCLRSNRDESATAPSSVEWISIGASEYSATDCTGSTQCDPYLSISWSLPTPTPTITDTPTITATPTTTPTKTPTPTLAANCAYVAPSEDTYIQDVLYSGGWLSTECTNYDGQNILVGANINKDYRQLVRVDFTSAVPLGATVTSCAYKEYVYSASSGATAFVYNLINETDAPLWDETTACWASFDTCTAPTPTPQPTVWQTPIEQPTPGVDSTLSTSTGWRSTGLDSLCVESQSNRSGIMDWITSYFADENPAKVMGVRSKDFVTAELRPYMHVCWTGGYTPTPTPTPTVTPTYTDPSTHTPTSTPTATCRDCDEGATCDSGPYVAATPSGTCIECTSDCAECAP